MHIQLHSEFDDVIQSLRNNSVEFFLAASLYHARKISFTSAAHLAGLDFQSFKSRLMEHFSEGYLMFEECVLDDMQTLEKL